MNHHGARGTHATLETIINDHLKQQSADFDVVKVEIKPVFKEMPTSY